MGFFSAIKKNLNHGGVKVTLQAPAVITTDDLTLNATLEIVADQPQQINKVVVRLVRTRHENNNAFEEDSGTRPDASEFVLGSFIHEQPFTLQPNIPVSVPVTIQYQLQAAGSNTILGDGQIAHVFDKLQKFENMAGNIRYTYEITAGVDVEGIALDPGDRKPIEISGAGQL